MALSTLKCVSHWEYMGSMFRIKGSVFQRMVKIFLLLISEELCEGMLVEQRSRDMMRHFPRQTGFLNIIPMLYTPLTSRFNKQIAGLETIEKARAFSSRNTSHMGRRWRYQYIPQVWRQAHQLVVLVLFQI